MAEFTTSGNQDSVATDWRIQEEGPQGLRQLLAIRSIAAFAIPVQEHHRTSALKGPLERFANPWEVEPALGMGPDLIVQ
jgi:hypothetical protein